MTNEDNKAIAQHCIDAINRQDAAAMTEVLSPKWVEEFTAMFPGVNARWGRASGCGCRRRKPAQNY